MKLGFSICQSYGKTVPEAVQLLKSIGFDAISPEWMPAGDHIAYLEAAKQAGMVVQSIHAPYEKAKDMWGSDEAKGEAAINELLSCLQDCASYGVPVMVAHAFIGFKDHTPTAQGLERFGTVVKEARRLGIKIALENTEGEEYLFALMEHFAGDETVGFCWDSGHEMCYNHSQDLLEKYGDRLLITHLNDNLGIRDFEGRITWLDDLHLLPFDGILDWDRAAERLRQADCPAILNFELNLRSKPGRHENDPYGQMTAEEYLTECYKRACRVAAKIVI